MSSPESFVDAVLDGHALLDDIDDYVDAWHDAPDEQATLPAFLGLTDVEYALWVEHPESLRFVFAARKHESSVPEIREIANLAAAAARANEDEEAKELLKWLKNTGRV